MIYKFEGLEVSIDGQTFHVDGRLELFWSKYGYVDFDSLWIDYVSDEDGYMIELSKYDETDFAIEIRNIFDEFNSELWLEAEKYYNDMKD